MCAEIFAIRKVASAKTDRLQIYLPFASSFIDHTDGHTARREPSGSIIPILIRYSVNLSTALVPQ